MPSVAHRAVDRAIVKDFCARIAPAWECRLFGDDGGIFTRGSLQVIVSLAYESDGDIWVHVSACVRTGQTKYALPSWDDMKRVKHDFIGGHRWAYQVFATDAEHVNINPYVLHLFARLDGRPALPDFTNGAGSL